MRFTFSSTFRMSVSLVKLSKRLQKLVLGLFRRPGSDRVLPRHYVDAPRLCLEVPHQISTFGHERPQVRELDGLSAQVLVLARLQWPPFSHGALEALVDQPQGAAPAHLRERVLQ